MSIPRYLLWLLTLLSMFACNTKREQGERLARKACASCHMFPEPELLDRKSWKEGVLPEMELRMGQRLTGLSVANTAELREILQVLPGSPMLTDEEWELIAQYYERTAPETLTDGATRPVNTLSRFDATALSLPVTGRTSLTVIKESPEGKIYIGTRDGKLFTLNSDLSVADSVALPSAPSHILLRKNGAPLVLCMGIMDPNDQPAGSVVELQGNGKFRTLADSLKRPVFMEETDLNKDGLPDLLVSSFGNFTGSLVVLENAKDHYRRRTIHNFSGTRKTITRDFNNDGLPDIMALITQGDERIALFTNRGNFRFSYKVLLKFPPVYGSSYFELADFNGDGLDDILLTSGDNADYSPVLKPYHGVRIFLNDGRDQFTQSWFYPMHGASVARAHDFDRDGDLDIAAISFFPDFQRTPQHGFLYFENNGNGFEAYSTPVAASSRWITMALTDLDNDGDSDILLGALAFPSKVPDSLVSVWTRERSSLLVLTNRTVENR